MTSSVDAFEAEIMILSYTLILPLSKLQNSNW